MLRAEKNPWAPFALLLIDVQQDFWTEGTARAFPGFPENLERLLTVCRRDGPDIVHVHARFRADRSDAMVRYHLIDRRLPCIDGTPGVEVLPCAQPLPGEAVIEKQSFDAFINPRVDQWLREHGKRFVLVAGLVSSVCVLFSAASAAQRGYLVAVIEDCCADEPGAHGFATGNYPFVFETVDSGALADRRSLWLEMLAGIAP